MRQALRLAHGTARGFLRAFFWSFVAVHGDIGPNELKKSQKFSKNFQIVKFHFKK